MTHEPPSSRPAPGAGFAERLDAAMTERGLTLVRLRTTLRDRGLAVSLATLSYWRSGQRRPEGARSLEVVQEIEDVLGLPSGHLLWARGPSRRPGPRESVASPESVLPAGLPVREAMARLDVADWADRIRQEEVHGTLDVGPDGAQQQVQTRSLIRALVDGVRAYPVVIFAEEPFLEPPALVAVAGCTVGRDYLDVEQGLAVWELVLPRPLALGETLFVDCTVRLPRVSRPRTEYFHYATRRVTRLSVWARFHPDAVPGRCELVTGRTGSPEEVVVVDPSSGAGAHVVAQGFGPGRVGVRWGDDRERAPLTPARGR